MRSTPSHSFFKPTYYSTAHHIIICLMLIIVRCFATTDILVSILRGTNHIVVLLILMVDWCIDVLVVTWVFWSMLPSIFWHTCVRLRIVLICAENTVCSGTMISLRWSYSRHPTVSFPSFSLTPIIIIANSCFYKVLHSCTRGSISLLSLIAANVDSLK